MYSKRFWRLATQNSCGRGRSARRSLHVQRLEARDVPAVFASFANGTLSVISDGGDAITVVNDAGQVRVNGADPDTGPLAVGAVLALEVTGGPLANVIDLSAVSTDNNFRPDLTVAVTGAGGDDTIFGSQFADRFFWNVGDGNDVYFGNGGGDTLFRGNGALASVGFTFGAAGTDTLALGSETLIATQVENYEDAQLTAESVAFTFPSGDDTITVSGMSGADLRSMLVSQGAVARRAVFATPFDALSIDAGAGNDRIVFQGITFNPDRPLNSVTLDGGKGTDALELTAAFASQPAFSVARYRLNGAGDQSVRVSKSGGSGLDIAFPNISQVTDLIAAADRLFDYSGVAKATTVTLADGPIGGAIASSTGSASIEFVPGVAVGVKTGPGNDTVNAAKFSFGTAFDTGAGNDLITGTDGDDTFAPGLGNDTVNGLGGNDLFLYATGDGNDRFDGGTGNNEIRLTGSAQSATYSFPNGPTAGFRVQLADGTSTATLDAIGVVLAADSIATVARAYRLPNTTNMATVSPGQLALVADGNGFLFDFTVPSDAFTLTGGTGDDRFTFGGLGGPAPANGVTLDGGTGTNSLELIASSAGTTSFGRVDYNYAAKTQALEIRLNSIEPPGFVLPNIQAVADRLSATARSFRFTGAGTAAAYAIGESPAEGDFSRITAGSSINRVIDFPTTALGELKLATGQKTDTVTFNGLDPAFPAGAPVNVTGAQGTLVIAAGFNPSAASLPRIDVNLTAAGTGAVLLGNNPLEFAGLASIIQTVAVDAGLTLDLPQTAIAATLSPVAKSDALSRLSFPGFAYDFVNPGETLAVNGRGGNDALTFAGLNPTDPPDAVRFDGGAGSDRLIVTATPGGKPTAKVRYDLNKLAVEFEGATTRLTFANVGSLRDEVSSDRRVIDLPPTSDAATISGGATADGFSRLEAPLLGLEIDFRNPAVRLQVNGNAGDDTLTFLGSDAKNRPSEIALSGGTGTNFVRFNVAAQAAAYTLGETSQIRFDGSDLSAAEFTGFFDDAGHDSLTFDLRAGASETIADNGVVGDGRSRLTNSGGDFVEFINPSKLFQVNGSGAKTGETITFAGYDPAADRKTQKISIDFGGGSTEQSPDTFRITRPSSDVVFDFPNRAVNLDGLVVNYSNQRVTDFTGIAALSLTFKLQQGVTERISDDDGSQAVSKLQLLEQDGRPAEVPFITLFRLPSSLLRFDMNGGDEKLIFAGLDPIGRPVAGMKVVGGAGNDELVIEPTGATRIDYTFDTRNLAGIDGFTIDYDGVELVTDRAAGVQRRSFAVAQNDVTLTVEPSAADANLSELVATGEPLAAGTKAVTNRVRFLNPGAQLNLSTGPGHDSVTITGLSETLPANADLALSLFTGSGKDTITLNPSAQARVFVDGGSPTLTPPTDQGDNLTVNVARRDRFLVRDPNDPRSGTIRTRDGSFREIAFTDIENLVGESDSLAVKLFAVGTGMSPNLTGPLPPGVTALQLGIGPTQVVVYDADYSVRFRFTPFGTNFAGGVSVATADVNGDLVDDIVVGAGPGGGPHVRVFDGRTLAEIASFFAFDPRFTGGVRVAAADLDDRSVGGIPRAEVVVGAGPGGGPNVRAFRIDPSDGTPELFWDFFAFAPSFVGGVTVAAGVPGVVVGAGPGGGPHVRVFDPFRGAITFDQFVFDPAYTGGVSVAAGEAAEGSADDPIARFAVSQFAATAPTVPVVRVFEGGGSGYAVKIDFFAISSSFLGGVNLGMFNPRPFDDEGNLQGDQILVGLARAGGRLRVLNDLGRQLTEDSPFGLTYANGIYVG